MASESKLDLSETYSDLPPESFWVATDDEQDWFTTNAVMQRKTSLKIGYNRNFKSLSHRSVVDVSHSRKPSRQSVFGLPTVQKNPSEKKGTPLFRSRSEPAVKTVVHVAEPGSPRVSCTGRVGLTSGDGKKTGFSRIFGSLFRSKSEKNRSRRRGNSIGSKG